MACGITQSVGSGEPGTVTVPGGGTTGGTVTGGTNVVPPPFPSRPVTGGGPSPGAFDEPPAPGVGSPGSEAGGGTEGAMPLIAALPPCPGVDVPSSLPHATSTVADVSSPRIGPTIVVFTAVHAAGARIDL